MKCIVVDDMGPMRRTVSLTLKDLGFENISEAKNGKDAFDLIKASYNDAGSEIELAIVDWNMEPVSGIELLKMVRSDEKIKDIIFIMITAEQLQDNVIVAAQSGVDDYIIKPFSPEIVKEKFVNVTKKRLAEIRKDAHDFFNNEAPVIDSGGAISWGASEMARFKTRILKFAPLCDWTYLVQLELGKLFMKFNDFKEAEIWLRQALSVDFGVSEAHAMLSRALRGMGKIPESVKELEIAIVENPNSGELKQKLGEAYLKRKNYDKALELLTDALRIFREKDDKKKMAKSKSARGETKLAKGEDQNDSELKEEAVTDIKDAVQLDPAQVSAHYNLMVAYKATGRVKEAEEVLLRIRSMEPDDWQGWIALGKAFIVKSEFSKVKFAFKKADEFSEGLSEVYEEIATTFYKNQMFDEAIEYLDKAKEANPSNIFSYNLKGIIYRMRDNNTAAIREYENAVKIEPDNAGIYFNLGVAHFKSGHEDKSEEFFKKAKEHDPGSEEMDAYLKNLKQP